MMSIMKGDVKSLRHELFTVKKERANCSGMRMSQLIRLSNNTFLGNDREKDDEVMRYLINDIFLPNLEEADPRVRDLGSDVALLYSSCVLFPETIIHQHEVSTYIER